MLFVNYSEYNLPISVRLRTRRDYYQILRRRARTGRLQFWTLVIQFIGSCFIYFLILTF